MSACACAFASPRCVRVCVCVLAVYVLMMLRDLPAKKKLGAIVGSIVYLLLNFLFGQFSLYCVQRARPLLCVVHCMYNCILAFMQLSSAVLFLFWRILLDNKSL